MVGAKTQKQADREAKAKKAAQYIKGNKKNKKS